MKKLFAMTLALLAALSFSSSAFAGPLTCTFKAEDGSTVNFCTARVMARFGSTINITDAAGVNNVVGDTGGSLWSKFVNWTGRAGHYVVFQGYYYNVNSAERTGCIGSQSFIQWAGQTYPSYYSDSCLFSNAVNQAAAQ
jgi:hypothetical protein